MWLSGTKVPMQAQMELLGGGRGGSGSGSESKDQGTRNAKQHIFWM